MNAAPGSPSHLTRRELSKAFVGSSIGGVLPRVNSRDEGRAVWQTFHGDAAHTGYCQGGDDPISGDVLWDDDLDEEIRASPVVADGAMVVATTDGRVVAFELDDGTKRWERQGSNDIKWTPAVDSKSVYVYLNEGEMHALDVRTGESRWRLGFEVTPLEIDRSVLVDDVLYIGTPYVWAIDTASGNILWKATPEEQAPTGLAVSDDRVFIASRGVAEALDVADGSQIWRSEYEEAMWSPLTIGDDIYLPLAPPAEIWALSTETGELRWKTQITKEPRESIATSPIVTDEGIIAADHKGTVAALSDDDGSVQWRYSLDGDMDDHPVACGETLYIPTDGDMVALSTSTGEVQWRTEVGELPNSPAIVGDRLLVTTEGGRVLALGSERGFLERWGAELGAGTAGLLGLGGYGVYHHLKTQ